MTAEPPIEQLDSLAYIRTADASPWTDCQHQTQSDAGPRPAFEGDGDPLIRSEHSRRMQHNTLMLIVAEGDLCGASDMSLRNAGNPT